MKKIISIFMLFIMLLSGCTKTYNIEDISNITSKNIKTMYITHSFITSSATYVEEEYYRKFYRVMDMQYEEINNIEEKDYAITYFFYAIESDEGDVIFVFYLGSTYKEVEMDKYILIRYNDKYYISTRKNSRLFKVTNDYLKEFDPFEVY